MTDKRAIRERVWDHLEAEGIARFPFPPHGRIPNFDGADEAAERAMALPELEGADAVKANPDAPQLPLRRALLRQGTTVYMAVPRLAEEACFVELDPAEIEDPEAAPTVSSTGEYGRRVRPDAVPELDAIVVGSVAVTEAGTRVGKGEGYSDLEYAILREHGLVNEGTPVITTVHGDQVVGDDVAPDEHDVPIDLICTPTDVVEVDADAARPSGVRWERLDEARIAEMPALERLRES